MLFWHAQKRYDGLKYYLGGYYYAGSERNSGLN
jgi:hypothetical protein